MQTLMRIEWCKNYNMYCIEILAYFELYDAFLNF